MTEEVAPPPPQSSQSSLGPPASKATESESNEIPEDEANAPREDASQSAAATATAASNDDDGRRVSPTLGRPLEGPSEDEIADDDDDDADGEGCVPSAHSMPSPARRPSLNLREKMTLKISEELRRASSPLAAAEPPVPAERKKERRRSMMLENRMQSISHRSFFMPSPPPAARRSRRGRIISRLFSNVEEEGGAEEDDSSSSDRSEGSAENSTVRPSITPQSSGSRLGDWRSRTMNFFTQLNQENHDAGEEDDDDESSASSTIPPPPDSEVERIVQRLEDRNANRVAVPAEVKGRFLRLCNEACRKRCAILEADSNNHHDAGSGSNNHHDNNDNDNDNNNNNNNNNSAHSAGGEIISSCILRSDIIRIRQSIRLEVEGRTRWRRLADGVQSRFGFRCHCEALMNVLNRALDSIDERGMGGHAVSVAGARRREKRRDKERRRRRSMDEGTSATTMRARSLGLNRFLSTAGDDNNDNNDDDDDPETAGGADDDDEWFYYKDFAFYSLVVESNYPWMRNASVFSMLLTAAFYVFTPLLWCTILRDPNICPREEGKNAGWWSALAYASATMSTVGYGDITVFVGSVDPHAPEPEQWRIFLATCIMILSLVVSVVGFQAGLDSRVYPFRRRLDGFGRRVYEILRDADVVRGRDVDGLEEIATRMRWSKFTQLAEICLIFLLLNLVGVMALQLSLLREEEDDFGEILRLSWMESIYWAVQTTTTIGYGDVDTPKSLRWFLLLYLAISTYYVGSAFGKLGELSKELESMHLLYLWQQQEASYTMLHDFSGRPDRSDGGSSDSDDEGAKEILDFEPEIDQFEFTIASLVVMGKITSEDVRPILDKFKRLTGENPNKITTSDVSGPMRKKTNDPPETHEGNEGHDSGLDDSTSSVRLNPLKRPSTMVVGKQIAQAFREEVLSNSSGPRHSVGPRHSLGPRHSIGYRNSIFREVDFEAETEKVGASHHFRIPNNTYAIAIDDSKIQRKSLAKIFDSAGIPPDRRTICGDGYSEIMGFEDYVVNFMESHNDDYVFMIVDENLDVVDESSKNHHTVSGSQCVENIRRRLPPETERRMFALIRSATDSSSDIAIYKTRAHGFLPEGPIKREKMNEILAPLWQERFPPSEFGESLGIRSLSDSEGASTAHGIACILHDVSQKMNDIEALFAKNTHATEPHLIHDDMNELRADLQTLNSNVSVHYVVGLIDRIRVTQAPDILMYRWQALRRNISEVTQSLQKNFRLPPNTYAIAIDDSNIQRKLLGKLFQFLNIPSENCTIIGDGYTEIQGVEDFVVDFMQGHKNDYVFMVVDENLDVFDDSNPKFISVSGSQCVHNIRQRLPAELERRIFALIRSANNSTSDVVIYNERAHGHLPKAPIRRDKVNETLMPLWMKRFPPSDSEFEDSAVYEHLLDESISIAALDAIASTPDDISQKLIYIESLFKKEAHLIDMRIINDQLHELKGDLLSFKSDASMISILGMIKLILLGKTPPEDIFDKWRALRDRTYAAINTTQSSSHGNEGQSAALTQKSKLWGVLRSTISREPAMLDTHSTKNRNSLNGSFTRTKSLRGKHPRSRSTINRDPTMLDKSSTKKGDSLTKSFPATNTPFGEQPFSTSEASMSSSDILDHSDSIEK